MMMSKLLKPLAFLTLAFIFTLPLSIEAKDKVKLSKSQKLQHKRAYNLLALELYEEAIEEYNKLIEMRGDYDQFLFG